MTTLRLDLKDHGYDITVGRGILKDAGTLFNLGRRVAVLTDSGVPEKYARAVAESAKNSTVITVPEGEGSKSLSTLEVVLSKMAELGMTRGDALVAVGGGVVGDLGGFAAATYMRGIDFYNVPTTLLSQVDSSIGGKTAVNLGGIKNIVGAFHQPKGVLIDADCLKTLDDRLFSCGLAEAVKMAATSDEKLFEDLEKLSFVDIKANIEDIIVRSLKIKKMIVEEDELECGLRRTLNFGHTYGHGVEAASEMDGLYHGECVAIGMMPMCSPEARERLGAVLTKLGLPTAYGGDVKAALDFVSHDKKCESDSVKAIYVPSIGSFEIRTLGIEEFKSLVLSAIDS